MIMSYIRDRLNFINILSFHQKLLFMVLILLGAHFFDYHPWWFVVTTLFLINWRAVRTVETLLVFALILSMYVIWYTFDAKILEHSLFLGQGVLVLTMFLAGLSASQYQRENIYNHKILFYALYLFFIAYMFSLLCSYMILDPATQINREGMHVCFGNEYMRLGVNGGNLISTIIAYYLTPMVLLLPFLVIHYTDFKKALFHTVEIIVLIALSLFALFLSIEMQRRTVVLLLLISLIYIVLYRLFALSAKLSVKQGLLILLIVGTGMGIGYYFFSETLLMSRLLHEGLHDSRFGWWKDALGVMMEYPWGGGFDVVLGNKTKLAHNVWIDLGKDFGIIPFTIFLLLSLRLGYRLLHFVFYTKASVWMKHLMVLLAIVFGVISMIEPIFNSDKTFFVYLFYYTGFLVGLDRLKTN